MTIETKKVQKTIFSGIESLRIHNLTLQGGVKSILDFTVATDLESRKSDFYQVSGLTVEFDGALIQNVLAYAMAHQKVVWAPSLRDNPTRIGELSGKVVRFGEPLFTDLAKKAKTVTVARPPTEAEQAAYIAALSPMRKLEMAIAAMKQAGMDTTLVEAELEALKEVEGK